MDNWEKFNETSLPEKEDVYSHLNVEDISDVYYVHAKRVCKDLKIKSISQSGHYVQLENALQKHFLAYSALIMGTFLIAVPKVKILQGVPLSSIYHNLPVWSKISFNKKS